MHCVSADMRMGRGVAVTFRKKFGRVEVLLRQRVSPGGCAVLPVENRFIYYLVTKQRCYGKPTYNSLETSLRAARQHCLNQNMTGWTEVGKSIKTDRLSFPGNDIFITVYI